ncbi:YdeI/OmpD-associated family protein [Nocardioides KLBMP 9356]|uniref:YdeI/OmpD-associated family protein n=1 Tax=Nocardioides potassii TaxID=2911371 RepID=A0ABS9HA79_9ACTN|nr:YdeI/OmpD-associated family protein [Nocardioides potassii]MCF6378112.1 YdeI/OmpD-associated family protein [Nocardioides potassii]
MDKPRVHATTVGEWRSWLEDHHATATGVYLVSWKKHTGKPRVEYEDAVTEALAVGWVDSKPAALDKDRTMLWFSPRKPTSAWSAPNKHRIERLVAEGRLTQAGQAVIDAAKANGAWTRLDAVERGVVPPDLAAALAAHSGAAEHWETFPRSVKRGILEWIVQAKRPETRERRVRETAERAARGERANQWR